MAKLLKQVWKTFYGSFFETEKEAAEAEMQWRVDAAITEAWKEAIRPSQEKYERDSAEWRKNIRDYSVYSSRSSVPSPPQAPQYMKPPLFQSELTKALLKSGALTEPKLSSANDQDSSQA